MRWFSKREEGLVGLVLSGKQAHVAHVVRDKAGRALLKTLDTVGIEEDARRGLQRAAERDRVSRVRCSTLLSAEDYQLLLVEAPDVRPEELRAAVRWRIKDLINFHIDDAVIDVFDIPGQANRAAGRMMYAVAARAGVIRDRARQLEEAGFRLDVIDIPEMALRNVAALLPEDARGVAFLHLERDSGFITISRQGTLYLTRRLETGYGALRRSLSRAGVLDSIVLEIQRSLDYYESHYDAPPISRLVVSPLPEDMPALLEHLRENLNLEVSELDMSKVLDGADAVDNESLLAVGAALRREELAL